MSRQEAYQRINSEFFTYQSMVLFTLYRCASNLHSLVLFTLHITIINYLINLCTKLFYLFIYYFLEFLSQSFLPQLSLTHPWCVSQVTKMKFWLQVCIWVYLWVDDNSVVEFIGKIFIAGKCNSELSKQVSQGLSLGISLFFSIESLCMLSLTSFV